MEQKSFPIDKGYISVKKPIPMEEKKNKDIGIGNPSIPPPHNFMLNGMIR